MSFSGKPANFLSSNITSDGFYPEFSLGDFQRDYRIPTEFATDTVVEHVRMAIMEINGLLEDQREVWEAQGFAKLDEVTGQTVDGLSGPVVQYRNAVSCYAKAMLLKQSESMVRREDAENLAKTSEEPQQFWLAQCDKAIRRLHGYKVSIGAELL